MLPIDVSTPEAPTQPSEKQIFLTLRNLGADDHEAFTLVQWIQQMAGQNVLAEIRTEIAKLGTQLESQQRQINFLFWLIGVGFTGLAILITVLSLLD